AAYFYAYRPYLETFGLNSGYGYFSDGDFSDHLKWFCIEYEDGRKRWYKTSQRNLSPLDPLQVDVVRRSHLAWYSGSFSAEDPSEDETRNRLTRSRGENGIPLRPSNPQNSQYRRPENYVRDHVLPSFVRYLCMQEDAKHTDGKARIKSVKVYDVIHRIP